MSVCFEINTFKKSHKIVKIDKKRYVDRLKTQMKNIPKSHPSVITRMLLLK